MRPAILKAYALGIITGGFLTAGVVFAAAPAKADTGYDTAVCATLADYPTFDGILGIGAALKDRGFTSSEAGVIVGTAVYGTCPEYIPLVKRFIAAYGHNADSKVA